jgi:protein SCO1/2
MRVVFTVLVIALLVSAGCSRARRYELHGQILGLDPARQEITIKHEDIRGFMPGMTMPFRVRDPRLLEGLNVGDLVTATLVVENSDAYVAALQRTGHAELTELPAALPRIDVLASGDPIPDVRWTDETGAAGSPADWRDRALAVTFIYTRCPLPDFCPRMDRNFSAVQREVLADARLRDRVMLVSVSFDPAFDTPTVLAGHARRAGADPRVWRFVTGDPDAIAAFAARFGVSVIRDDANRAAITHNLRTAVVRPGGKIVQMFSGNEWSAADLLADLRRAVG